MTVKKIIHIDMDCFYASIEMRDQPKLKDVPLAIGGQAHERGVLATCNYPARRFGLHSAMPTAQALRLCPQLHLLKPRLAYYREVSHQIHTIFRHHTDLVESVSLDEAYLDVTGANNAADIAKNIRRLIRQQLDLPASAGIASLKFLAKIASSINKPNNQCVIPPQKIKTFLRTLPLKKLPGVGKSTAHQLASLGLLTCEDIWHFSRPRLWQLFGKQGETIWAYSHGIDTREVQVNRPRKSISVERTFTNNLNTLEAAEMQIPILYQRLIQRLSPLFTPRDFLGLHQLSLKMRLHNFQIIRIQHSGVYLSEYTFLALLRELWSIHQVTSIRLLGLQLTLSRKQSTTQLDFWEDS